MHAFSNLNEKSFHVLVSSLIFRYGKRIAPAYGAFGVVRLEKNPKEAKLMNHFHACLLSSNGLLPFLLFLHLVTGHLKD